MLTRTLCAATLYTAILGYLFFDGRWAGSLKALLASGLFYEQRR